MGRGAARVCHRQSRCLLEHPANLHASMGVEMNVGTCRNMWAMALFSLSFVAPVGLLLCLPMWSPARQLDLLRAFSIHGPGLTMGLR